MKKLKFYAILCVFVAISLVVTPAITLVGNTDANTPSQTTTQKAATQDG